MFYMLLSPIGVRPLFYGKNENNEIMFASECKSLLGICNDIKPFPPGNVCTVNLNNLSYTFEKYYHYVYPIVFDEYEICKNNIEYLLTEAVKKRLASDRKLGVFISGGVDSSIV